MAHEALVREARRIDFDRSDDPEGVLLWRVKMRIVDWLRANGSRRELHRGEGDWTARSPTVSLDTPIRGTGQSRGEARTIEDVVPAPEEEIDSAEKLALRKKIAALPERERILIFELFHEDRTEESLAREWQVSPSRISQLRSQALVRLQEEDRNVEVNLGRRELEVLTAAAAGLGAKETADELILSLETVKDYRKRAIAALGAKNIVEAVAIAIRTGLVE